MTPTEKLLKRLPKKYHPMVRKLEPECDLVDDCQYILYFNDGVSFCGYEDAYSWPVKSITEAIKYIKEDCELQ